ncbi:MAG: ankyrin repeat domain-containing protein [Patescibacteria group bacterium]|nr:ankyrin repeat domain-containing protein [Patescibacteria group bacterium]
MAVNKLNRFYAGVIAVSPAGMTTGVASALYDPTLLRARLKKIMSSKDPANAHIGDSTHTPLTLAIRSNDAKAVCQLIDRRADVNLPERNGNTALCLSICHGVPAITKLLTESGAEISKEITELLLYRWADPSREAVEKARKWQLTN